MLVLDEREWPKFFAHSTFYRGPEDAEQVIVYRYDSAEQQRPLLTGSGWQFPWVLGVGSYQVACTEFQGYDFRRITADELITKWGMSAHHLYCDVAPIFQQWMHEPCL